MFTAALFIVAKIQRQPKCSSVNEQIKKMQHRHTHTHTRILFSVKKKKKKQEWNPVTTWMAPEGIMLSEKVRQRQIPYR